MTLLTTQPPAELATTEDAFLGGRIVVAQPVKGSRAGLDAVFLAAACPAKPGETVLELGSGSGIVSLAVAARIDGASVTGVEVDPALCELARDNARRNGLAGRVAFVCGDVTAPAKRLIEAGLAPDSFGHGLANPPFLAAGEARLSPEPMLCRAHAAAAGDLESWLRCLAAFIKPGGTVTIVHRADALPQLLSHAQGRFGGITIYPLFPRQGAPASRVLLHGRKGSRAPMRLAHGMVLHGAGNSFTPDAEAILRAGAGLDVAGHK
jgi:tRNA1(Val) A37 N6-methylase TrmN6